ncbi:MAG: class II glutamine amidotransferase [Candidatus Helarchaeota archaeon]
MCELCGISANIKIGFKKIYSEFRSHSDIHKDGWGIAFYEPRTFNIIKEAKPAYQSSLSKFIAESDYVKSHLIIAHIRRASHGNVSLRNTHPFQREFFGKPWVFAHNGTVFERPELRNFKLNYYFPIGQTDSELAFCYILDRLRNKGHKTTKGEIIDSIMSSINAIDVGAFGFNFLMSDTEYLYAYRGKRGPTLYFTNHSIGNADKSIIISTKKLKESGINGKWVLMRRGELIIIKEGVILQDLRLN